MEAITEDHIDLMIELEDTNVIKHLGFLAHVVMKYNGDKSNAVNRKGDKELEDALETLGLVEVNGKMVSMNPIALVLFGSLVLSEDGAFGDTIFDSLDLWEDMIDHFKKKLPKPQVEPYDDDEDEDEDEDEPWDDIPW